MGLRITVKSCMVGEIEEMSEKKRLFSNTEIGESFSVTGMVFDIKRFAMHDGHGIRTTAFLKGCPLSCTWCHNPESQRAGRELLFRDGLCRGCGACVAACPEEAIRLREGVAVTDRSRCTACGVCVPVCPADARELVGEIWSADALADELARDTLFYDQSAGGVTLSGGEPLAQPAFCVEVLRRCRARGLHTAVDTCGHADEDALRIVAEQTDLFLYDLKLMDAERHRRSTGVTNEKVFANLERIDRWEKPIWIRVPLIPGINDDEENLAELAVFLRPFRRVEAVHVLPYHRGGEAKWAGLGREDDTYPGIGPECSADAAERAVRFLGDRLDVPVKRGG